MLSSRFRAQSNTEQLSEGQIRAVLNSCNIRIGGEIDTHYLIYCPFHYNVNTPACEIDKQNGLFICFSCGENGHLLDIVMKTTGRNFFEAKRMIRSKEESVDFNNIVDIMLDNPSNELKEFDQEVVDRLHIGLMNSDKAQQYFLSRNINEQSWSDLRLGYSNKKDMVTVPVHDSYGTCVGFVARGIDQKVFKNSTGLPRRQILFNLHRVKHSTIAVVESSFDAIRMRQLSIPAVATLGAMPSKHQIELLSKYANNVVLCPDKDDAGKKMVTKVRDALVNKNIQIMDVGDAKDVGDLADNEIISRYINASNLNIVGI